jgi:uncharacterized membrane protein YeaQ/YmgE (transglycosylase-associated protein family)
VPGWELILAMTVLLGSIGSIIGGVVANAFGNGDVFGNNLLGSLLAVTASIALVVIGERMGLLRLRFNNRR